MESCKRKPTPAQSPGEDEDDDHGDDDEDTNREFAEFKRWLDSTNPSSQSKTVAAGPKPLALPACSSYFDSLQTSQNLIVDNYLFWCYDLI